MASETAKKRSKKGKKKHLGKRERESKKLVQYFSGDLDHEVPSKTFKLPKSLTKTGSILHEIGEEIYCSSSEDELDEKPQKEPKKYTDRTEQKCTKKEHKDRLERTAFIGNLPPKIDRKKLIRMFNKCIKEDEACQKVDCQLESLRIRGATSMSGGTSRGAKKRAAIMKELPEKGAPRVIAYVVFTHVEGVDAALKLNNHIVTCKAIEDEKEVEISRHIQVDRALSQRGSACVQNSIFIGNLPLDCSDEAVREVFSNFGKIRSVRLIRDKATGAVKGVGYVEFEDHASVKGALDHAEPLLIKDRQIRVDKWRSVAKTPNNNNNSVEPKKPKKPKMKGEKFDGFLRKKIVLPTNLKGAKREKLLKQKIRKVRNKILPKKRTNQKSNETTS